MKTMKDLIYDRKLLSDQMARTNKIGDKERWNELQKELEMINNNIMYLHREENKNDHEPKTRGRRKEYKSRVGKEVHRTA